MNTILNSFSATIDQTFPVLVPENKTQVLKAISATMAQGADVDTYKDATGVITKKKDKKL